jgi:hypothetical protein
MVARWSGAAPSNPSRPRTTSWAGWTCCRGRCGRLGGRRRRRRRAGRWHQWPGPLGARRMRLLTVRTQLLNARALRLKLEASTRPPRRLKTTSAVCPALLLAPPSSNWTSRASSIPTMWWSTPMDTSGTVAADTGEGRPASADLITTLISSLSEQRNNPRAAAIVADVKLPKSTATPSTSPWSTPSKSRSRPYCPTDVGGSVAPSTTTTSRPAQQQRSSGQPASRAPPTRAAPPYAPMHGHRRASALTLAAQQAP